MKPSEIARNNLRILVAIYRGATGISLSAASHKFYGNGSFFNKLEDGRQSLAMDTLDAVLERMSDAWPEAVAWPELPAISMDRPKK